MRWCRLETCLPVLLALLMLGSQATLAADQEQGKKKARPKREPNPIFAPVEDDPALPRVLLIGDSISIGYTLPTRKRLEGVANVHRIPTNGGPTIRGLEQIDAWLGKSKWDVIHFNWGLHDLRMDEPGKHQVPIDQYEKNLVTLLERLQKTGAKLIWCSTTPVPEGAAKRHPGDEVKFNRVAAKVMQAHDVPTNDLYAFALPQLDKIQREANVHFTPAGSAVLAEAVSQAIKQALGK